MFIKIFIIYISVFLFSEGCNKSQNEQENEIKNRRWVMTSMKDFEIVGPTTGKNAFIVLDYNDNSIRGNGGCNSLFGTYKLDGKKLRFGEIGATRMYCDDVMDMETKFINNLKLIDSFKVSGDQLYLYSNGVEYITFKEALLN
jgi:heat shock protein HslJ